MLNTENWESVIDRFAHAAVNGSWEPALAGMAELCGFRSGQLVGFGATSAVCFNFLTGVDPVATREFTAVGGGDPACNPRLRAASLAPLMTSLAESDFVTAGEFQSSPYYNEYCARHDLQFGCVMPIMRSDKNMIGLAMFRGFSQGNIGAKERQLFETIAPHARAAVRTQTILENQGGLILAGALDALSLPIFICDRSGKVRGSTRSADELLRQGNVLRARHGQLQSARADESELLADAIRRIAMGASAKAGTSIATLAILGSDERMHVLDIVPLPQRDHAFGNEPRALVVVRGSRHDRNRLSTLLQTAYRLTPSEAQVAIQIADGLSADTIALARSVSVSTVRVQIRNIFIKLGVRRQSELVARLNHLG